MNSCKISLSNKEDLLLKNQIRELNLVAQKIILLFQENQLKQEVQKKLIPLKQQEIFLMQKQVQEEEIHALEDHRHKEIPMTQTL